MPVAPQPRWDAGRKRWYFNVDGRRYTRVRKADAYDLLSQLMRDKPLGFDRPDSVAKLVAMYLRFKADPWVARMLRDWLALAGTMPLDQLDPTTLLILRDELLATGQSPRTIRHKVGTAHRCLRWGKERGYVAAIPDMPRTPKVHANPRDVPLPVLLQGLQRLRPHGRALATFILLTGCRPSEARLARWEHFDLEQSRWHVPRSKTGAGRTIELTQEAVELLQARWKPERSAGYVFTNRAGQPYTRSGFGSMCRRVGFSQYQLRHTFAQHAFDQGVDAAIVAELLGHKGLDSVLVYMQVRRQRVRDAVQRLRSPLQRGLRDGSGPPGDSHAESRTPPETLPRTPRKNARHRLAL